MEIKGMTHKETKQMVLVDIHRSLDYFEGLVSRFENDANSVYGDYGCMREIIEFLSSSAGCMEHLYEFLRRAEDAPEEDRPKNPIAFLRNKKKENKS